MRRPPPGGGGIGRPVALVGGRGGNRRCRGRRAERRPVAASAAAAAGRSTGAGAGAGRGRQARVGDDAGRAHHTVRGLGGDRRLELDLGGRCELDVGSRGAQRRRPGPARARATPPARRRLGCGPCGPSRLRAGFSAGGASTTGSSTVGSRRSPSASARRRTRSASGSSMLEEWLFTPILRRSHRSSTTWFSTPSSRASS